MAIVRCGKVGVSLGIADIDTFLLGEHTNQSSTHFTSSLPDRRFEIFGSFGYVTDNSGFFAGVRAHTGVVKGWSAFLADELIPIGVKADSFGVLKRAGV